MMDEITRVAWINPDANLLVLLKKLGLDDEGLAELLSLIWHRSLYPGVEIESAKAPAVQSLVKLEAILQK